MILITGATGQLGTSVINQLLKIGPTNRIAALVRDAQRATELGNRGVSLRVGHYDDPESLREAMRGIERVLLIAGTDEQRRVQQHQNVVDAAKGAGVQGIAYTSRTLKNRATVANTLMGGHFQTEDAVQSSGLAFAIFRNVLYMDAIPQFVGEKVFESGITVPAGQGQVAFALRSEMGEAIANALAADTWPQDIHHLTGREAYSFGDVAAELTRLSGREVPYHSAEAATFAARMIGRGVPEPVAQRVVGFMTDIANGQEDEVFPDLERLLGRAPTSLRDGLKSLYRL